MGKQRDPEILEALRKLNFGEWLEREGLVQFNHKPASGNWTGLAVHRGESHPSFTYIPDRGDGYGIYHDMAGEGGTFLDFVTKEQGMTMREAIDMLFQLTGGRPARSPQEKKRLADAHWDAKNTIETLTAAALFYHENLTEEGRSYLHGRGFTDETIDRFKLGIGGGLFDMLKERGIEERWAWRAGLLSKSQKGHTYETMMHRITIPYWRGDRCMFMTGRTMKADVEPKYRMLGTSQTDRRISPAIDAQVLFNEDAFARARRAGVILGVVEGQFDAMAIEQAGWPAVALSGLGGNTGRVKALVKKSEGTSLVLVPDIEPNGSGVKSARIVGEALFRAERETSVCILTHQADEKTDAAAYLQAHSKASFDERFVGEAVSYVEWLIEDIDRDLKGAKLTKKLSPIFKMMGEALRGDRFTERESYMRAVKNRFKLPLKEIRSAIAQHTRKAVEDEKAEEQSSSSNQRHLHGEYLYNDKGTIKQLLHNAAIFLEEEPMMKGLLGFDERAQDIVVLEQRVAGIPAGILQAQGVTRLLRLCTKMLRTNFTTRTFYELIVSEAMRRPFDPFKQYLESLEHDPEAPTILDTWLPHLTGLPRSEYLIQVGRWWPISIVARAFCPGSQVDHMLVLEGDQGIGKSQFFKAMAKEPRWYSGRSPDFQSKDSLIHLCGKVIIEIGELLQSGRAGTEATKAFLSEATDHFRPPYAVKEVIVPRRVVFGGSTNDRRYLQDPTGSRRMWCVPFGEREIDVPWVEAHRDQIFAEAVYELQNGAKWWPSKDDEVFEQEIEEVWDSRRSRHPWFELFESALKERPIPVTMSACLTAVGLEKGKWTKRDRLEIENTLAELGWTFHRPRLSNGARPRIYLPPNFEHPERWSMDENWSTLTLR